VARDLSKCAVVITGASSGIGRAAAHEFARCGSDLVLAARAADPLEAAAGECRELGVQALAVPTDVRDEAAVEELARRAEEAFDRLDVWVNGAGVMAYGRFEQVPSEVFRAVIETNLMGQVHGTRAALRRFRRQRSGVVVNMASVWGRVTSPEVSAYVASKFAVRAFSESVRQELRDLPDVDVTTMLPQAVDTPIFENAANYSGRRVRPIPPLIEPEEVARGIVLCAQSPKREVTYSRVGRLAELAHSIAPGLYNRLLPPAFEAGNYGQEPAEIGPGALIQPADNGGVTGGWKQERRTELRRALRDGLAGLADGVRPRR
jgi:short-subunit dehydrogenase